MKTTITITIESKDEYDNVYPEPLEDRPAEDYKTEEDKKYLRDFHKEFAEGVHQSAIDAIEGRLDDGDVDEMFFDQLQDKGFCLEDWEERSDYDLTIKIEKSKETDGPRGCPEGHKGGNER